MRAVNALQFPQLATDLVSADELPRTCRKGLLKYDPLFQRREWTVHAAHRVQHFADILLRVAIRLALVQLVRSRASCCGTIKRSRV